MYVYSGPSSDFPQDEVTQQALKPRRANEWSTYVTQKCAAIPLHHRGLPRVQLSSHGRRPTITRDAAMSVPGEHGPHRDNYIPIMRQFKTNHLVLQPRRVGRSIGIHESIIFIWLVIQLLCTSVQSRRRRVDSVVWCNNIVTDHRRVGQGLPAHAGPMPFHLHCRLHTG